MPIILREKLFENFMKHLLYRVIKKSLCTWWLQYSRQVHRDFLITLYILLCTSVIRWLSELSGTVEFVHVKVCTCCDRLSTPSLIGESTHISRPSGDYHQLLCTDNLYVKVRTYEVYQAIIDSCYALKTFRWKYVHIEAIWRLSTTVMHWKHLGESMYISRPFGDCRQLLCTENI